jgi:hypothetical protein
MRHGGTKKLPDFFNKFMAFNAPAGAPILTRPPRPAPASLPDS